MKNDTAPIVKENVNKVVIMPYKDKTYNQQDTAQGLFALPVNPETYTQNYKVEYDLRRGQGQQGTDPKFKSTVPEELKLEFTFDGTGAIEGYHNPDNLSVAEQIEKFKTTVYKMNGDIHRPRFLKIFWGKLKFPCILTSLDINFVLFDPEGMPLRAKISANFVNYIAQEERVAREDKSSPDLTHLRKVEAGNRLDLMTYNIYGDSRYVLQIAKANGLTSFRNIKAGQDIRFPPFDKTEI